MKIRPNKNEESVMTAEFTIYHNPKCSKSRKTLELLRTAEIEPNIVEYLRNPPDAATLKDILTKLRISARELMRQKESTFTDLHLDDPSLNEEDLIAAMVDNPILIERPIVVSDDQAVIGRPPENIYSLLNV